MRRTYILTTLLLIGCGDPDTNDDRGYTKAPLERPTVLVQGERESAMAELGDPLLPQAPLIEAEKEDAEKPTDAPKPPQKPAAAPPAGATAADVTEGEKIFAAVGNCYTCHGQAGAGTGMAPALNDREWLNIDGSFPALQQLITEGVMQPKQFAGMMPAKGGAPLSDQQVKQVAAYVYTISR